MIEILSSESLINPQIDFLLFLQNLRVLHFECFNDFFLSVTILGEMWLPTVLCAIVYWCIDLKSGVYLFSLLSLNVVFAQLFKMIACVYRPWVLSDKIHPVDKAVTLAKGYSFPSGHSAIASSVLGGISFLLKHKILISVLILLLVLLVGFSRMWLGVHTPQDVVAGLTIGFALVFLMNIFIEKANKNNNLYLFILGIVNLFAVLSIIYVCYFNQYPQDFTDGQLLVDPKSSIQTFIVCYGYVLGIINGAFLTIRFFPFDPKAGSLKSKIVRTIVGAVCIYLLFTFVLKYMFCSYMDYKIVFPLAFFIGFFITAIYPLVFSKIIMKQ